MITRLKFMSPGEPAFDHYNVAMTPGEAFADVLFVHLSSDTCVKWFTDTHLRCTTPFNGYLDSFSFSGTEEEMRPIIKMAALYVVLERDHSDEVYAKARELVGSAPGAGLLRLRFTTASMATYAGMRARVAALMALGVEYEGMHLEVPWGVLLEALRRHIDLDEPLLLMTTT